MHEQVVNLTFTWRDLEQKLLALADGPTQREMAPFLVSGLRKQKPFLTPDLLLEEILAIAACIADARFPTLDALTSLDTASRRDSA